MQLFTTINLKRQDFSLGFSFPFHCHQFICLLLVLYLTGLEATQIVNASTPQQTKRTGTRRTATNKRKVKEPELNLEGINLDDLDLSPVTDKKVNWAKAASSDSYLILYSPKRLIRLSKNTIRVWTKRQSIGADKKDDGFILRLNEYNCETRMSRTIAIAMYDAFGKRMINSFTLNNASTPSMEWEYVLPDTLEEEELITICNNLK